MTSPSPPALPGTACTSESKGAACTGSAVCYKTCGPENQGAKTLTCTNDTYVEGSCTFSATTNYACYRLTNVQVCAATPPTGGTTCTLAECQACGNATDTGYFDSGGNSKVGYCVCSASGKWSCASTTAWPCPDGTGC